MNSDHGASKDFIDDSLSRMDSLALLTHHDLSDAGSLIGIAITDANADYPKWEHPWIPQSWIRQSFITSNNVPLLTVLELET